MNIKRALKRMGKSLCPAGLKNALRRRLLKPEKGLSKLEVHLNPAPHGYDATVGNAIGLKLSDAARAHFESQFTGDDYQPEMSAFLKEAKRGGTLFDVGAHMGFFSIVFCASNPSAKAFAFEPSPILNPSLANLIALNDMIGRINQRPVGVGAEPGSMELLLDHDAGFVQVIKFAHSMGDNTEVVRVDIVTIDDECERLGIAPTLIKIDVEGYEWEVLQGAMKTLKNHRPVLFVELHLDYLEQRGIKPASVLKLLASCGYRFSHLNGHKRTARSIYDSLRSVERFITRA